MGKTIIEKILGLHCGHEVSPGDIADIEIDVRAARDFGGANVVKNLKENNLNIHDPQKTFFTFDCNPGGSDQKYATNQQLCRDYARQHDIKIYEGAQHSFFNEQGRNFDPDAAADAWARMLAFFDNYLKTPETD